MNDNNKQGRFATYEESVAALRREEFATQAEFLRAFPPRPPTREELDREERDRRSFFGGGGPLNLLSLQFDD